MNFKVGDEVVVITGSDKGKKGKIIKTLRNENKVGPNEPCPCGSGKKYKKCCGRST